MSTTDRDAEESRWHGLCKIGGVAAFVLLAYSVLTLVQLMTLGGPPTTAKEAFTLLQESRAVGLLRLDLPTLIVVPAVYSLWQEAVLKRR